MGQLHLAIAPPPSSYQSPSSNSLSGLANSTTAFAMLGVFLMLGLGRVLYQQHRRHTLRRQTAVLERLWRTNTNERIS